MADKKMYKVGITVKEPWSADISYEVLDITLYAVENGGDGCSYIAIRANQGVTPGTDDTVWVKATQRGQSIYDLAVKYGDFEGTEAEFEAEYEAAVHAAQSAAQSASDIEAQVETNEAARVTAERARSDAETARSSAETARINAENARNDAESLRDTAESDRVRAEAGRVTAEASRVEAETFRQGAEQSRRQQFEGLKTDMETAIDNVDAKSAEIAEDIEGYEANEAGRVSAENARAAAESARVSAEQDRATAETARQTAEGNRATAETERASAEGARTTAEQGRVSAEQGRVSAESGRVSAESDRVSAETARESASATAVSNAETATQAANTAAEHAEEAATTIDDKIAGKADESDVSQLRQEVTDLFVRKIDYCDMEDYIPQTIALDTVGYYNYKLTPVSHDSSANFKCVKITGVVPGDMYKFDGYVAYSKLAAVVFMDSQDNCIGYLYGDNTSTEIHFDTGIISIPSGCASVAFNAYIGAGHISTLTKYSLPKTLLKGDVNEIVLDIVNPDNDMVANLVPVDVGHFYNGNTLAYTANSVFSCAVADVNPNDKVSYSGKVRYSALYAVIFADNNGTILQRIGNNPSAEETVNTGIIDVPVGATKVYFGALGNSFTAYIYKQPSLVNEFSFQEFYDNAQNKTRYCNPYHYVMGVSQPDDLANSGFDANFESSTVGAFLVHNKYFRSYRRKHEWKVKLSATSVVRFGTGNNSNSIVVNDRMSHYVVDVPNSLLRIYRPSGTQETTVALGAIDPDAVYILRYEQYDYTMKVSVVDFATLDVVATFTNTATPSSSPLGKILGRPFIELQAGSLKVIGYDCYLMDKPKIVFIGDSITECGYRQDTYAAMIIRNKLKNDGCIIAQGGANNGVLTYARTAELPFMKPEYLSLLVGTNGTITTRDIQAWVSFCQEQGIKIIFNCVPVSLDPDNHPWATKNATIRSQGLLGAAFDYATALDNDPDDGGDPALFGDDVHPNADGQKAMYDRFLNDVHIFD